MLGACGLDGGLNSKRVPSQKNLMVGSSGLYGGLNGSSIYCYTKKDEIMLMCNTCRDFSFNYDTS